MHGLVGEVKLIPRRGFTLIELLVSIAIIGILTSILMPSLHKAREITKSAVCMNNLKTCGVGNVMYSDQYNDWAVAQWQKSSGYPRWSQIKPFRSYVGWNKDNVHDWHIPNELACPVGVEKKLSEGLNDTSDNGNAIKAFYSYEHVAIFGNKSYRGMRMGWLTEPSAMGNAADIWKSVRVTKDMMDARHQNKVNFLFFDGHVKGISKNAATAAWGGAHSGSSPWADSSDWTLTDYSSAYNQ